MRDACRGGLLLGALLGLCLLASCSSRLHTAQTPLPDLSIGVVGFSQPTHALELIAGYLPEYQGVIDPNALPRLDADFRAALDKTGRAYKHLGPMPFFDDQKAGSSERLGRGNALSYWIDVGKRADVDILIVPMIIDWREREGSDAGVTSSAAVIADIFLIDARGQGNLLQRSFYREKQVGLASNILSFAVFVRRGGKWVTAVALAREAMQKAIQEFGL
jgi:hypothetical protein